MEEVDSLIDLVNRQYRQISKEGITRKWDDSRYTPCCIIDFPSRTQRIAFEALVGDMMQGCCYVLGNSRLSWVYC